MRTKAQKDADEFDRKLFSLMDEARQLGENGNTRWSDISMLLHRARRSVRGFMHPDDRKGSES